MADPRVYQIAVLSSLLVYGMGWLEFDITLPRVCLLLATVLGVQAIGDRLTPGPRRPINFKSALISGLSLCLLLRTNRPELAVLAAVVTIAAKFLIRFRGKHLFNPTNGGIVAMLLLTDHVWVSPGQWGTAAFFAVLMACLGGLVVHRALRSDVAYAFIAFYAALLVGRSLYLGEPMMIPLHRLEGGALLLFTFFMISDPKTTPDSRLGRVLFAGLVAYGAWYVQFRMFRTNGLLWSLATCSMTVPLLDWLLPGTKYSWRVGRDSTAASREASKTAWLDRLTTSPVSSLPNGVSSESVFCNRSLLSKGRLRMRRLVFGVVVAAAIAWSTPTVLGFCGFYVAKADTKLFNKASQVVLVRDGNRTVMTMVSDFKGDLKEFAVVIPVPTFLRREQIHVGEKALVDHLDAYSAPRLVEYFDGNPCQLAVLESVRAMASPASPMMRQDAAAKARSLGVTIEAQYTVGEYDILILSAQQSSGLETWLRENGYKIPAGASEVIGSYLKQNMRFFVAKVNLAEQAKLGFSNLRPLQVAYESPKFMLPIRLGMVNASGPQELFVYALTRKGRVETTNYRTVRLPSDMELPEYLKAPGEFASFYKAMFARQVDVQQRSAVFLEYAWDMRWCDPCAADPLSTDELRQLGVFWTDDAAGVQPGSPGVVRPRFAPAGGPTDVFVTRLHVRYDNAHFPEDLVFQETGDRANVQGRYVLRHAWTGQQTCDAAVAYRRSLRDRREQEVRRLASLTGWNVDELRRKVGLGPEGGTEVTPAAWWERIWKK